MFRRRGFGVESSLAATPAKTLEGSIVRFECGDNCYLIVRDTARVEHTVLCVATMCRAWNEATEIPRRLVGRRVRVALGQRKQFNGSGEEMGDFPSLTAIKLLE